MQPPRPNATALVSDERIPLWQAVFLRRCTCVFAV
jgi:hypothetical protein